jgi:hypothetical protein
MAKRRQRQSAEGTFLEQVMGRLSALEKLIAELHWTTVGPWQFVEPAMDYSFCKPMACPTLGCQAKLVAGETPLK